MRALDMSTRIKRARSIAAAACGVGLLAAAPEMGWWTLLLFGIVAVNLATLDRRIARSDCPERVIAGSLILISVCLAVGAAVTGGPTSPVLFWLILPAAMAAARFRSRVVLAGGVFTAVEMIAVATLVDPAALVAEPQGLIGALVLLIGTLALAIALMGAELQFRSESVLDPLTGLLNRAGLESRFAELAEQARLLHKPVCLLACDLDNFKGVNDTHGHDRGDLVLKEAAYEMRKALRSFELFYRLGGEEFLVVLPGMDAEGGAQVAERVRAAIEETRPGGVDLTISIGVSAGEENELEYEPLFRRADEELYRAKDAGRNRVSVAGGEAVGQEASTAVLIA